MYIATKSASRFMKEGTVQNSAKTLRPPRLAAVNYAQIVNRRGAEDRRDTQS